MHTPTMTFQLDGTRVVQDYAILNDPTLITSDLISRDENVHTA